MKVKDLKKILDGIGDNVEVKIYSDGFDDIDELHKIMGTSPDSSYYEDVDEENIGLIDFDDGNKVFLISPIGQIIN